MIKQRTTDAVRLKRMERQAADLERLWDALSWLQTSDPESADDIEGKFQISVHLREVYKLKPPGRRGVVA